MANLSESSTTQVVRAAAAASRQAPKRDDFWTVEATSTLMDAWGARFLEVNRGNLRPKDWQEVADAVNALHGHTKKTTRTDVQCKNRIDTLKKKYKAEKAKITDSSGTITSSWPLFARMDEFIGRNVTKQHAGMISVATPVVFKEAVLTHPSPPLAVPLNNRKLPSSSIFTPVILPQKRPLPLLTVDESNVIKNNSAMVVAAAAAAAGVHTVDAGEGDLDAEDTVGIQGRGKKEEDEGDEGSKRMAKAIERFVEVYERVESLKQKQMVELEKQRMQFAKDLEVQRMQLFLDTQVQLQKIKQAKRSGSFDDVYG